jgi:hypothetical protein
MKILHWLEIGNFKGWSHSKMVPIQGAGRPPRQSTPDRLMLRGQGIGGVS